MKRITKILKLLASVFVVIFAPKGIILLPILVPVIIVLSFLFPENAHQLKVAISEQVDKHFSKSEDTES